MRVFLPSLRSPPLMLRLDRKLPKVAEHRSLIIRQEDSGVGLLLCVSHHSHRTNPRGEAEHLSANQTTSE